MSPHGMMNTPTGQLMKTGWVDNNKTLALEDFESFHSCSKDLRMQSEAYCIVLTTSQ